MSEILLAAIIWVATHLGLSSTGLRQSLVKIVGASGFLILYSLIAAGALGYLIYLYGQVERLDYMWLPNPDLYWAPKIIMVVAMILLVGSFMVKNPTMVGMTLDADEAGDLAKGVTRITRHPLQWAIVLWGLSHMVANGDLVSWIFFASFVLISFFGTMLMDRKKAEAFGQAWQTYAGVTSNLPFGAIASGRNKLVWGELWLPIAVGLVAYALAYYFHEAITGTVVI